MEALNCLPPKTWQSTPPDAKVRGRAGEAQVDRGLADGAGRTAGRPTGGHQGKKGEGHQASKHGGAILLQPIYARAMGLALLILACLLLGILSADSRPGFSGLRSSVKDRWFPHSRRD